MLELGGIKAWISSNGRGLSELRKESSGELSIGFVEAQEGASFGVCFRIADRAHDYTARCVVDGTLHASRAVARDERNRESHISAVTVTEDGSKVQHFQFAQTHGDGGSPALPFLHKRHPRTQVGTIRLTLSRCELERVTSTSDRTSNFGLPASHTDSAIASHRTKLGSVRYDQPRKAYRLQSEQETPWVTFVWVYGSASLLESVDLDSLNLATGAPSAPRYRHIDQASERSKPSDKLGSLNIRPHQFRPYHGRSSSTSSESSTKSEPSTPPESPERRAQSPVLQHKASFFSRIGKHMKRQDSSSSSTSSLRNELDCEDGGDG